jgi:integrase
MPVYRRAGSPFWWYSFTVNGRRFRGSTGRAAKREAEEVERDQHQLARRSLARGADWTLLAVLNAYWSERAKTLRSGPTILTHFAELQKGLGKDKRTSRLTNGDLMDYRARRRGQGVQQHSINRELAYLRAAYQHCHRFHGQPMPAIEWKGLKAKEPPHRIRFLSREEYARLIAAAHPGVRPIIVCAVATGLRQENIISLDWRQVKLEERVIQFKRMKSGKPFAVRISPALMAVLSALPGRRGRVFDTTGFRYRWYRAVKDAELDDFRFHDLRHTFASWARQGGADLADIAEALDHSSISMTMRYAHIKPDEHRTAFDRVSDSLLAQSVAQSEAKPLAANGENL